MFFNLQTYETKHASLDYRRSLNGSTHRSARRPAQRGINSSDPFPYSTPFYSQNHPVPGSSPWDTPLFQLPHDSPIIFKISGRGWPRLTRFRSIVAKFRKGYFRSLEFLNFLLIAQRLASSLLESLSRWIQFRGSVSSLRISSRSWPLVSIDVPPSFLVTRHAKKLVTPPIRRFSPVYRPFRWSFESFNSDSSPVSLQVTGWKTSNRAALSRWKSYRSKIIGKLYLPSAPREL